MEKVIEFNTAFTNIEIQNVLREHTLITAYGFQTIPFFANKYFSGQVGDQNVRLKNSMRTTVKFYGMRTLDYSPTLEVSIDPVQHGSCVTVYDDSDDEISTDKIMAIVISSCMSFVVLLIGAIIAVQNSSWTSFVWSVLISVFFCQRHCTELVSVRKHSTF